MMLNNVTQRGVRRGRGRPRLSKACLEQRRILRRGVECSPSISSSLSGYHYNSSNISMCSENHRAYLNVNCRHDSSSRVTYSRKELLKQLIERISAKDSLSIFAVPVSKEEVPDYSSVITDPMDFSTMSSNFEKGKYTTLEDIDTDVKLIINNCKSYNGPSTVFYKAALKLESSWAVLLKKAEAKLSQIVEDDGFSTLSSNCSFNKGRKQNNNKEVNFGSKRVKKRDYMNENDVNNYTQRNWNGISQSTRRMMSSVWSYLISNSFAPHLNSNDPHNNTQTTRPSTLDEIINTFIENQDSSSMDNKASPFLYACEQLGVIIQSFLNTYPNIDDIGLNTLVESVLIKTTPPLLQNLHHTNNKPNNTLMMSIPITQEMQPTLIHSFSELKKLKPTLLIPPLDENNNNHNDNTNTNTNKNDKDNDNKTEPSNKSLNNTLNFNNSNQCTKNYNSEPMRYSNSVKKFIGYDNLKSLNQLYPALEIAIDSYNPIDSPATVPFTDLRLYGFDTDDYVPFNTKIAIDPSYHLGVGFNHIKTALTLEPTLKESLPNDCLDPPLLPIRLLNAKYNRPQQPSSN